MPGALKLEVPIANDGLSVAANIKVAIASAAFSPSLTPEVNEDSEYM